jgi:glycosyltransferase involved in cell wall biosynthesis
MNILFVHQHMPGQFGRLAAHLARNSENRVVFLTKTDRRAPTGVTRALYGTQRHADPTTHHYLRSFEEAVLHGQAVARACLRLQQRGFVPDVVVAHPGWGEPMYIKDIFPHAKLLNYCEFFYRATGADVGFDPAEPHDVDIAARVRTRNAPLMIALEACDRGLAPTSWQRSVHPREWQDKIEVIFDGVDTSRVGPDPEATFQLPGGRVLSRRDPVVTYVARNLEPYRGFPSFMRAVPRILEALPDADIVIVGGDGVSYGRASADGRSWRQVMTDEIEPDPRRVHFIDTLAYADYLRLLQVSSAHVYLTVPFVLSWSAMEALASGCVVIGSRTPPVEEVVRHGENGILVDFFATAEIADAVVDAVRRREDLAALRRRARESIIGRYDLATCLARQLDLIARLAGQASQTRVA